MKSVKKATEEALVEGEVAQSEEILGEELTITEEAPVEGEVAPQPEINYITNV